MRQASQYFKIHETMSMIHIPLGSPRHPNTCNIYRSNNIHKFLSGHRRIIIIIPFGSLMHYEWIKIHINISCNTSRQNVYFRVTEASKNLQHLRVKSYPSISFGSSTHHNNNSFLVIEALWMNKNSYKYLTHLRHQDIVFALGSPRHPNTCNIYGTNNIHQFLSGHQCIMIVSKFSSYIIWYMSDN